MWRSTQLTHPQYLATCTHRSPFCKIEGHVFQHNKHDSMHVMFNCGTCNDIVASCLLEAAEAGEWSPGGDIAENLRAGHDAYVEWARVHSKENRASRAWTIALLHATKDEWVSLSGTYKCGHCRSMMFWFCSLLADRPILNMHDALKQTVVVQMCRFIRCCLGSGPLFEPAVQKIAREAGRAALLAYQGLVKERSVDPNKRTWRVRPKLHSLDHVIARLEEPINDRSIPEFHSCWGDEALMGVFAKLCKRCHVLSMKAALQRYAVAQEMLWSLWKDGVGRSKKRRARDATAA